MDNPTAPTRPRKRNRYIWLACDECRRRKVKCSGDRPCQRCDMLALSCTYEQGPQHNNHDGSMKQTVDDMQATIASMQGQIASIMCQMSRNSCPRPAPAVEPVSVGANSDMPPPDPLFLITLDEAVRYIDIYNQAVSQTYPVVDGEFVLSHARAVWDPAAQVHESGLLQSRDTAMLRAILAVGIVVDNGHQRREMTDLLFQGVKSALDEQLFHSAANTSGVVLFTLASFYFFYLSQELQAWRMISSATRLVLELRLHTKEGWDSLDAPTRDLCTRIFWSVYILDQRLSSANNVPFSLHDSDFERSVPAPASAEYPYFTTMVEYSRLCSKVHTFLAPYTRGNDDRIDSAKSEFLHYQIEQWYDHLPKDLKFNIQEPEGSSSVAYPLRALLYLRRNQLRTLIERPRLHSTMAIMEDSARARAIIETANDTIRALVHINNASAMYQSQPVALDYFLASALSVHLHAACHGPPDFAPLCYTQFMEAVELVKSLPRGFESVRLQTLVKTTGNLVRARGLAPLDARHSPSGEGSSLAIELCNLFGATMANGNANQAYCRGMSRGVALDGVGEGDLAGWLESGGPVSLDALPLLGHDELASIFGDLR
ncbi:hypothetical protein ASPCAL02416 [Aspergillus calidoustus]|uniref:Zn(2)-C6 fungal-type domain-containing protein n=1 Tax=Aspergillus calidoustus TaxID=454130 RepID=A0A0U5GSB7_ASPCI|nr:hypothetical protein ASPCAL02416 [Aspergillus calidoustus]